MKLYPLAAVACSVAIFVLSGCKKSDTITPPKPTPPTGTMQLSMAIDSSTELIVSETGGNVLLDTIAAANSTLSATIHTNDALVDLTAIVYYNSFNDYNIVTYKAVNPSTWTSPYQLIYPPYTIQFPRSYTQTNSVAFDLTPATTPVFNRSPLAPNQDSTIFISYYADQPIGNGYSFTTYYGGYPYYIITDYPAGINQLYLLYTATGQYYFYTPQSTIDTVSNFIMDTARNVKVNIPSEYTQVTPLQTIVNAFMDTTNLANSITLYPTSTNWNAIFTSDLQIPNIPIQKYEFGAMLTGTDSGTATFYSYADTLTTTPSLPDQSYYVLNAKQPSNFSVSFSKVQPTYYVVTLTNSNISWSLFASADSTSLQPLSMLTALHSKFLAAQNVTNLSFSNFYMQTVPGFDYGGFMAYSSDSTATKTKHLTYETSYSRSY